MKRGSIFETDGIPRMSEVYPLPCSMSQLLHRWLCHTGDHRFRSSSRRTLQRRPGYPDPVGTGHCSIVNFVSQLFPIGGKAKFAITQACLLSWVSALLTCQVCRRQRNRMEQQHHGCGDCWWYRSSCYGFAGQKRLGIFPAANHRTVVFTIGLSLYPTAINYMAGTSSPNYGSWQNWAIAFFTPIVVTALNHFERESGNWHHSIGIIVDIWF